MFYKTAKNSDSGKKISQFIQRKKLAEEEIEKIVNQVGAENWYEDLNGNFIAFRFKSVNKPCDKTFSSKEAGKEVVGDTIYKFYQSFPKRNTREGKKIAALISKVEKFCVFGTDKNKLFEWDGIIAIHGRDKYRGWFNFYESGEFYLINHHQCDRDRRPKMPVDCMEITESEFIK